jgi:predicted ATPase
MSTLPEGTVTFLFTDVEGSTQLLASLGAEAYAEELAEHRRVIRKAGARYDGVEVDTQGDAFFIAFPTAPGALKASREVTEELGAGPMRVRIGLHTGTPLVTDEGYVGADVHRAARIAASGHGGQVLISASTASLLNVELRDLGEHRFKDLAAAERVFQLGEVEFPPLDSLYRTNLPFTTTPFLGRTRELLEVIDLLRRDDVRLLTLTGPGGTGKTRLALQAAAEESDRYPDGVWWVPLAPLSDPALVVEQAAQVLGAKQMLSRHIDDKHLLLLFDNFEHVVRAGPNVAELVAACPNLAVLVTSREPLHVTGEQEYPVPPQVEQEAVELFYMRARAAVPDFSASTAVTEICRRLDCLPLAVELAAARVKALSPRAILDRLEQRLTLLTGGPRDVPERQRTLRGTIEWSYELLTQEERPLFARLAVFSGGCSLDTAGEIVAAELDTLQSLVDKSLLRHTEDRFSMLETIREFAAERLDASGDADEFRRRHAERFLALAEEAEPHLHGSPKEWLELLDREHDNLRAAFDQFEESGKSEHALRLGGALSPFWATRGYHAEGRRRLERALRSDERPTAARARALNGAVLLAIGGGDAMTARALAEEALALNRALGDALGTAHSTFQLGQAVADEGDVVRAQELFDESVRLFRELGDQHYTLLAAFALSWTYEELGDRERARALDEENLRQARELRNQRMIAIALRGLASYAVDEGRISDALSMLAESIRIVQELGEVPAIAATLCEFAAAFAVAGKAGTAVRLLACSEALHDEIGAGARPWLAEMNEKTLISIRTQLGEAALAQASAQSRALTADEAVALALDGLADA